METLRLGISRCLLGERVRYDGQHKYDPFLVETLGKYVAYVPVCPEVECGLPVPREAMRLVGDPENPRLMTQRTEQDLTGRMLDWARRRVVELEKENLCGFVFKSRSPSSGMERVKVYNGRGGLSGRAPGLFARLFMEHFPLLPAEDEGRLHDPGLRENFIERVFTLHRYREAVASARSVRPLTDFHAAHKLLLMAHSPAHLREMGRLLAQGKQTPLPRLRDAYEARLLEALKRHATVKKHVNVLQHLLGYFKKLLGADEKQEMLEVLDAYKRELVPLIVPVTLFNHYVRKYDVPYLAEQLYLRPYPLELKLRNHA
ncbi:MAG: DUF523 and DUF1722 domain-containing protein [Lentisphaerae bacterium]|nr:DUF523 and DUF1722 domain-containing protein [Lentisphaerota bacterium]